MGNSSNVKSGEILPEFQRFLLEKKLVPEKNVFFYAFWASKFFNYARKKQISNVETTMVYTHVMRDMAGAPKSPLDALFRPKRNGANGKGRAT